jgi:hypothetical protein
MSKRFGRNQKRALKAELMKAQQDNAAMEKRMRIAINSTAPMRDALDHVARTLGKHFIGLPPIENHVRTLERRYGMPRAALVDDLKYMAGNNEMAAMLSIAMDYLEVVSMGHVIDELRQEMHLRLRLPDGQVAYAVSLQGMQKMRTEDWAREISHIVAGQMAQYIIQGKKA